MRHAPDGPEEPSQTAWLAYFDGLAPQSPLYRVQAAVYVRELAGTVGLQQRDRILDFGCGFGFVAALLAPVVAEVRLWDPAPGMRAAAARTTAGSPNVRFCDLAARPPARQASDRAKALDLILVNSVVQYMGPDELWGWLGCWRDMLAPGGRLVLSDLIPPAHRGMSDVVDLLRLGARHGSAVRAARDAVGGLTHYWRTSRAAPLARVGPQLLAQHAADAGLDMSTLPRNLTHFRKRWSAVLRRRGDDA